MIIMLDCKKLNTDENLLAFLGISLKFPDYYGQNWDAFDECATDLSWMKKIDIEIIVINAGLLEEKLKDLLIDCLKNAENYWREKNKKFIVRIQ